MNYDSRPETEKHIEQVQECIGQIITDLVQRQIVHDQSKLEEPEKSGFDEWQPKLKMLEFGSDEYKSALVGMKRFLDHHYEFNDHHPEHFHFGADGMNLIQMLEMLADWKAATLRSPGGDIRKSIEINSKRFEIAPIVTAMLLNTVNYLKW